ncbi:MAG: UDP-N-acetylmuramate--L-alanine ligase [Spirochaetes bacterium]|nr:UDP-N-acetylmuramate--L-alanine ligase [Spirochaetota bacterium]
MDEPLKDVSQLSFYLVGIKGTGMAALAELLVRLGAHVRGSDTHDTFYTDGILQALGIPYAEGFREENLDPSVDYVVYSAAYNPETHPELVRARRLGLPLVSYPEALGALSATLPSAGVCGVHGKTTTTALAGTLVKATGLGGCVLAGSAVANFGNRSTYFGGKDFFIAETCEYRRHFLHFHPRWIVLTSIEEDHLDYFRDYEDILQAFVEYGQRLPEKGTLIFCADDPGATEAAIQILRARPDIWAIPYGTTAEGPYRIFGIQTGKGSTRFQLDGFPLAFEIHVPGEHTVRNATAAIALVCTIREQLMQESGEGGSCADAIEEGLVEGLSQFRGSKRRSEILGEASGILIADDYAHHPTAIRKTLEGFRSFYPERRLVVDFMSHTYSRTKALLEEFAQSFQVADAVILHKIYASARETNDGSVTGQDLFRAVQRNHPEVYYFEEVMDALPFLREYLKSGDLFITLGAGDNFRLSHALFDELIHHAQAQTPPTRIPSDLFDSRSKP